MTRGFVLCRFSSLGCWLGFKGLECGVHTYGLGTLEGCFSFNVDLLEHRVGNCVTWSCWFMLFVVLAIVVFLFYCFVWRPI